MKLSFILLCYNQGKEIRRCIDSIRLAGIPEDDYEIIVLDDGSTDNSKEILKDYNVRTVFMEKNTRNQALLRNIGIDIAKGTYLMFADGDDYYNSNELGKFYHEIKDRDFQMFFTSMMHYEIGTDHAFRTGITKEDLENPYREIDHGTQSYAVSKEFIVANRLYFDEVKYNYDSEDMYFTYRLLDNVRNYDFSTSENFIYFHLLYDGNNTYEKYQKEGYMDYMSDLHSDLIDMSERTNTHMLLNLFMVEELVRIYNTVRRKV